MQIRREIYAPIIARYNQSQYKYRPTSLANCVSSSGLLCTCMVADLLNSPTGAIHFRLIIASCDCNITTSVSRVHSSSRSGRRRGGTACPTISYICTGQPDAYIIQTALSLLYQNAI